MKTAVVIGSTGLIGSLVVKKLARDSVFSQIIAIVRNKASLTDIAFSNPKVRLLQFDFKNWPELEVQVSSNIGTSEASFFCCLGTSITQAGSQEAFKKVDYGYVVTFAKLAKSCRAQQLLIVSALGANKNSKNFYNKTKGEMEEAVQREFSGALHFLRPSLLLGERKDFRLIERIAVLLAPIYSPLLMGSLRKYRPVSAEKVAQAMLLLASKKISTGMFLENHDLLKIGGG
ncbi:MAG: NAD(P)H-binding protein [Bdellovibrionota bacterium]